MAVSKSNSVTIKPDESVEAKASEAISLVEYIETHKPHYGLVVSFKHEASKTEKGLADRTEDEWHSAFEEQSNRTYK